MNIPYITLLDLDKEREGGGWGRIKYVLEQLIQNGYELLQTDTGVLSDTAFSEMHNWDVNNSELCKAGLIIWKNTMFSFLHLWISTF